MRLTTHSDYALRILLQAAIEPDRLLSIAQVAQEQEISRNHAMKVVNQLANAGLLETTRGRNGGFRLGQPANEISIGEVVRLTEPSLSSADCANCILAPSCGLTPTLGEAVDAFLQVLDNRSLADVARSTRLPFHRTRA
ncbi:Rrf2 family transcriptional regulator [Erythrobacter mangrovi]|uniref:Rrf2 family transcriptional regulator n=1 Tax=Erythrobacter mangrovi TaxID=2739433 RepID=A0A7D4CLP8_9SPHN|nr:Rrf2 family transcriptional regulator [Erythrobacter mangrovi]QKG70848.1 Rrf2 family transcriptional regulator [Erythrobacter mangrovi]